MRSTWISKKASYKIWHTGLLYKLSELAFSANHINLVANLYLSILLHYVTYSVTVSVSAKAETCSEGEREEKIIYIVLH
jgi:hypothetical protein